MADPTLTAHFGNAAVGVHVVVRTYPTTRSRWWGDVRLTGDAKPRAHREAVTSAWDQRQQLAVRLALSRLYMRAIAV